MKHSEDSGLLETLAFSAGCSYISDLNQLVRSQSKRLVPILESLDSASYSLPEWRDAYFYLTGHPCMLTSPAVIRATLISRLSGQID